MSRGHGEIQRQVLKLLEPYELSIGPKDDGWRWLNEMACDIFDVDYPDRPTRAEMESVRRAVKTLEREGLAQVGYREDDMTVRMVVRRPQ
jgi:hypothetical protein